MEKTDEIEKKCGTCIYFIQHYRRGNKTTTEEFVTVGCGHCIDPRVKTRTEDTKACPHWQSIKNGRCALIP